MQNRNIKLRRCHAERQAEGVILVVCVERAVLQTNGNRVLLRQNLFIIEEVGERLAVVARTLELTSAGHLYEGHVAIDVVEHYCTQCIICLFATKEFLCRRSEDTACRTVSLTALTIDEQCPLVAALVLREDNRRKG